jgi:hypothetical protein
MSDVEFHSGKLKKIVRSEDQSLDEQCKLICIDAGITELSSYNNDWIDCLKDGKLGRKYFIYDDILYEFIEHEESSDNEYFMKLYPNEDGTISFIGSFYNGGTYLGEMLEEAFDKLNG